MTKFDTRYLKKSSKEVTTSLSVKILKPRTYRPDWESKRFAGEIKQNRNR